MADITMTHVQGRFRWTIIGNTPEGVEAVNSKLGGSNGVASVVDDYADQVSGIVSPLKVEMKLR